MVCLIIFVGTVTDVAGEVVELGSDVKKFKAGDKVVAKLQDMVCFNDVYFVASLHISRMEVSHYVETLIRSQYE